MTLSLTINEFLTVSEQPFVLCFYLLKWIMMTLYEAKLSFFEAVLNCGVFCHRYCELMHPHCMCAEG